MVSATTALVVLVPEAEILVKTYRDKYDPSASEGMPAHITVLYPFKKLDHIGEDVVANLHSLFSQHPCFHFSLGEIHRFPTALYLAPRPEIPFQMLTRAVAGQYPGTPPYGGTISAIVPHLTIAQDTNTQRLDEIRDAFQRACGGKLSIRGYAERVWLMVKDGRWRLQFSFALDGASHSESC